MLIDQAAKAAAGQPLARLIRRWRGDGPADVPDRDRIAGGEGLLQRFIEPPFLAGPRGVSVCVVHEWECSTECWRLFAQQEPVRLIGDSVLKRPLAAKARPDLWGLGFLRNTSAALRPAAWARQASCYALEALRSGSRLGAASF